MSFDAREELFPALDNALKQLNVIWDRIGIGRSAKEDRTSTVLRHIKGLLDEMVDEELVLETNIQKNVSDFTTELEQLTKELGLPPYKSPNGLATLLVEKDLRHKVESLRKEKKERLKIQARLKAEDQELCDKLSVTPYYIPSGATPTGDQLEQLKQHIEALSKEKTKRTNQFIYQKKQIADLMLEMERAPETSFEKEVLTEEEGQFLLSSENMHALEALLSEVQSSRNKLEELVSKLWNRIRTLWMRLEVPGHEQEMFEEGKSGIKSHVIDQLRTEVERCEAQKLANIQRFVDGIRGELEQWWNKSFYSAKQRSAFKHYSDNNYTEELLTKHEQELEQVKEYYELHKDILKLVEERESLFNKMIEFEKKANDPNRFFSDRGGRLLLEEKERKLLMKQLPKVEMSVKEEIHKWETDHGRPFLVNGMSFIQYIEKTWQDFEEAKIHEKEERQKAKDKLMKEEMHFGSKPSTPVKRRFQATTPSKTPKYRRVNESKTPSSISRIQHSTMYVSPYKKAPLSTSKVPQASKIMSSASKTAPGSRNRRRSNRLVRKALMERNEGNNETVFSQTTVSSGCSTANTVGGNISLASTGSYQDFAVGLNPSARPYCRSSIAPHPQSPHINRDLHRL